MHYWESPWVVTALVLVGLLLVAELARRVLPLGVVPSCIVAGVLGLLGGPDVLALLPVDRQVLETIVYHALGVVFIAIGLQRPAGPGGGGARSIALGVPFVMTVQTMIGLVAVLMLGDLHPGFGLMLPLGFEQGPGQALSLGAAWEAGGMPDGAQVGLAMAAIGFAWSIGAGIPLVAWGRARGHVAQTLAPRDPPAERGGEGMQGAGLDALTRQLAVIAGVYAVTFAVCAGLAAALEPLPGVAPMVWGFHFIVGGALAMAVRPLLGRISEEAVADEQLLRRIAGACVDGMTAASIAAVQIAVITAYAVPLLLVTTAGGLVTLAVCVGMARRAFPEAWFEHCVVWFGMSTGTLPMGLALLRIIDPELRSAAPRSAVVGSAGAVVPSIPLMLVVLPAAVAAWPEGWPLAGYLSLAACAVWAGALLAGWRVLGPTAGAGRARSGQV